MDQINDLYCLELLLVVYINLIVLIRRYRNIERVSPPILWHLRVFTQILDESFDASNIEIVHVD